MRHLAENSFVNISESILIEALIENDLTRTVSEDTHAHTHRVSCLAGVLAATASLAWGDGAH
jgi:hypothetical protein